MAKRRKNDRGSKESTLRRYEQQRKALRRRDDASKYSRGEGRPERSGRHDEGDEDEAGGLERMRRGGGRRGSGEPRTAPPREESREEARVISVDRGRVAVRGADGEAFHARPIQLPFPDPERTAVVGDLVSVSKARAVPRIVAVLPRRTALLRRDPSHGERGRVLAANVDLGVVVVTVDAPHPGLVERIRIALARGGVGAVVAVGKVDLADADRRREARRALAFLDAEGEAPLLVSALDGEGIDALRARLTGRTCVFVGQSGVGKSSLLNALDPEGARATFDVRETDGKGRHTTTRSELRVLPDGTAVIDTPGVRAFGLHDVTEDDVRAHFDDVTALRCRFRDCRHLGDAGCAADDAIAAGALDAARLARYQRVLRSLDE